LSLKLISFFAKTKMLNTSVVTLSQMVYGIQIDTKVMYNVRPPDVVCV